ncbi:hypothetical protein MRX96_017806 [Rhipicephalus microplus]
MFFPARNRPWIVIGIAGSDDVRELPVQRRQYVTNRTLIFPRHLRTSTRTSVNDDDRTRVLEQPHFHIEQLTEKDVQNLALIRDVDWLSPLRNLRPERAVQEIRHLPENCPNITVYLTRITWFYTWLAWRQRLGPWLLFRIDVSAQPVDYSVVLRRLLREQPPVSRPAALGVWLDRRAFYACMTVNRTPPYRRQSVVLPLYFGVAGLSWPRT